MQEKKVQHSSAIKKNNEAQLLVYLKSFCLLVWLNWIKGSAAKTLVINGIRYICVILHLIIAGLRHIVSLHFTVLINFDEY